MDDIVDSAERPERRAASRWLRASIAAVVVVAIGGAYSLGTRQSPYAIYTGRVQYGIDMFTVTAHGWSYDGGMRVEWHDTDGWHSGERPACFVSTSGILDNVRVGLVTKTSPEAGTRPVAWIDCAGSRHVSHS